MLALVSHPALVADTGGIDTMTREAGDFVAGLGLGHLGVEGQVQEAVEEQPAVHIQERGEAAAAGGRERSPGAQRRGGSSRSPGSAARVHLRRGGHGPRSGGQRWQRRPRTPGRGSVPRGETIQPGRFKPPASFSSASPPSRPQRCLLRAPSLPRGSPAALSHPPLLFVVLLRAHCSRLLPWRRRRAAS